MSEDAIAAAPKPRTRQELAGKYLTFVLDREEYALPVLKVREIIGMTDITAVPQVPACIKGVINLRGKVVPVIDLRLKFGFAAREYGERASIIVAEATIGGGRVLMGIIVDHVTDVLTIGVDEIEETPQFGDRVNTEYMCGMAKVKGAVKILLELDRILGADGAAAGALSRVA